MPPLLLLHVPYIIGSKLLQKYYIKIKGFYCVDKCPFQKCYYLVYDNLIQDNLVQDNLMQDSWL